MIHLYNSIQFNSKTHRTGKRADQNQKIQAKEKVKN